MTLIISGWTLVIMLVLAGIAGFILGAIVEALI